MLNSFCNAKLHAQRQSSGAREQVMTMTTIEDYAGDEDVQEFMSLETFIGAMVAIALTIFVIGGSLLSPHAPPELAASESLLGP